MLYPSCPPAVQILPCLSYKPKLELCIATSTRIHQTTHQTTHRTNEQPNPTMAGQFPYYQYTTQPLPDQYNFGPSGFQGFTAYVGAQPAQNQSPYRVCPIVATYPTLPQKNIAVNGALEPDRPQYAAGAVVGAATRYFPSGQGGTGIVVSPMSNAAAISQGAPNDWHAVGVHRHGQTVWIQDPQYVMGSQTRLPLVQGTSNVTRLLDSTGFGNVSMVQIQGYGGQQQECMGRSAQWVDNVIGAPGASEPFPLNTFVNGVLTPGYQVIARR
jgi:hypothetical protein